MIMIMIMMIIYIIANADNLDDDGYTVTQMNRLPTTATRSSHIGVSAINNEKYVIVKNLDGNIEY